MEPSKQYYPPMHTAEHILNQTMVRMFGCNRSFNNHIEKKKSKCDYYFDRNLTDEEAKALEIEVNTVIKQKLDVSEITMDRAEALKTFNLDKLPDQTGDKIRIIRIGDYDACPCIGAHTKNTSEIGTFTISTCSFENGVLRIRFKLAE